MTDLHDLRPPSGATHKRKRKGRGPGSGKGQTAGRGTKGQKARSGVHMPPGFEGGQMPLHRRVPKRGFTNPFRTVHEVVNVRDLDVLPESEERVTPEILHQYGLVDLGKDRPVKILGDGELERAFTVRVHALSKGARRKIEAAGGTVELLES